MVLAGSSLKQGCEQRWDNTDLKLGLGFYNYELTLVDSVADEVLTVDDGQWSILMHSQAVVEPPPYVHPWLSKTLCSAHYNKLVKLDLHSRGTSREVQGTWSVVHVKIRAALLPLAFADDLPAIVGGVVWVMHCLHETLFDIFWGAI
jgi:hypothetical protein